MHDSILLSPVTHTVEFSSAVKAINPNDIVMILIKFKGNDTMNTTKILAFTVIALASAIAGSAFSQTSDSEGSVALANVDGPIR